MRILLVDDERLVRLCTQDMLQELVPLAEFGSASNAAEAVNWVNENGAPNIAVIDYKMPLCNGVELIKKIAPLCLHTMWILLSGYQLTLSDEQLAQLPPCETLEKPAELADWKRILEHYQEREENLP